MDLRQIKDSQGLGALIRERRRELSMTQEQVAFVSGLTTRIVSELERGKPAAQYSTVLRVLEALGLNLYVKPR